MVRRDFARVRAERLLADVCVITHTPLLFANGTQRPGTPAQAFDIPVDVQRALSAAAQSVADSLSVTNPALLSMPLATVIAPGDVVTSGGHTFTVVADSTGTTDVIRKVLAKESIG